MNDVAATPGLTARQQTMLAVWEQHTYAEFGLKNADAALAVMTDHPYVLNIPSGTGGTGRAGVRQFYAEQMLPCLPPDFALVSVSRTLGENRIAEELVVRFTHTIRMDWMLPGVEATNRKLEFAVAGIIGFQGGKIATEHLYWDQATALSQLGALEHPAAGVGSARQLLKLTAQTPIP